MPKKIIPIILIAAVLAGGYYFLEMRPKETGETYYSGTVEATEVTLSAQIAGQVLEVTADEGDRVDEGDVLVRLDHALLDAQLEQAEAARTSAAGQYASVKATIKNVNANVSRSDNLYKAGSISEQQFDSVSTQQDVLKAQQTSAYGMIKQAEATAKFVKEQISKAEIKATVSGAVLTRSIEPGEMAMPGAALITIADLERCWVRIYIPETILGRVNLGQEVKLYTDSYPGKAYVGKITYISDKAEFTPKNVQTAEERVRLVYAVKVSVDNAGRELKIGMPVDAYLTE